MNRKRLFVAMLLSLALVAFVGCKKGEEKSAESGGANVITAKKVASDPADINSAEWNEAKETALTNDGASGGPFENKKLQVTVKSVYTKDGNISMLISWPVGEAGTTKEAWKLENGKWEKQKGDEDKVALNWEIKRIKNFATKGCAVVCHSESKNQDDWKYHTEDATQRGDMWVWKAYTTNPLGYAEDGYVDDDSRKGDPGTGKAKKNETPDKTKPKYMQDPSKKPTAEGFLVDDEAVEIKDYSKFKNGDIVPSWMLSKFTGSMADIKAKAKWENGAWKVMLQRKLETGDAENDVQFDTRRDYSFAIAVFNNSSKHNSYNSAPLKLIFD